MRESDWRAWVQGLPSTRPGLQEVQADLERQVVATNARLASAIWNRSKPSERASWIELNELNSKLMLIHRQLKALE